jgi:hypothetical protein
MPAQKDRTGAPGGETPAALAERLRERISADAHRNGPTQGNGADEIEVPSQREVAIDVCRAILAEAGAGTAEHSDDVVLITEAIGERMGFTGVQAGDLLAAARLHDIGKVWVPARILEKPGPLDDEEWEVIRRHTVVGEQILSSVSELTEVGHLVRHSHERWDGKGYPDGLAGAEIPLGSRIIFCADAFHAIRSDRPYRAGRSADEALAEIKRCAGSQFDPTVATALEEVVRERQSRPRGAGSSRLIALFMCLAIGGAGTAIARSDLLGDPDHPAPSSPAQVAPAVPPRPETPAGSTDPAASSGAPAKHRRHHAHASRHVKQATSGQTAAPDESTGGSGGWHGSGNSASAPGHTKPSSSSGPGKSGSAPGHNKPSVSSGPGKSGSAPGHTKRTSQGGATSSPGNSGSSPGHNKER